MLYILCTFDGMICRFPYQSVSKQEVPATKEDSPRRIPEIHKTDAFASAMGVPAGYCGDWPSVDRDALPPHHAAQLRLGTVSDEQFDWDQKEELFFTAHELHQRAKDMQQWWDDEYAKIQPPLESLPEEDRRREWEDLTAKASSENKSRGIRGLPCASRLSYFRCDIVLQFFAPMPGYICVDADFMGAMCCLIALYNYSFFVNLKTLYQMLCVCMRPKSWSGRHCITLVGIPRQCRGGFVLLGVYLPDCGCPGRRCTD